MATDDTGPGGRGSSTDGPGADAEIRPGRYRHYKSPPTREYEVLSEARHSETDEVLVVYRALYGEHGLWVRPKAMFFETVNVDGEVRPRFQPVDAD